MTNTIYLSAGIDSKEFDAKLSDVAELVFQAQQMIENLKCHDLSGVDSSLNKILRDLGDIKTYQYEVGEEDYYACNGAEQFNYVAR